MNKKTIKLIRSIFIIIITMMIDKVNIEGVHTSYLVLTPYPNLKFSYGGGEERSWQRKNLNNKKPWWLVGNYIVIIEITKLYLIN